MRLITLLTLLILITNCSKTTKQENTNNNDLALLEDITLLENKEYKTPIITFKELVISNAEKSITLTKNNILQSLTEAKSYKHCVIIVGTHTIVKISDLKNCKQSGSWGACMPQAEGYIKKGKLIYKKDYINNIIGLPDNQERTAYLLN